MKIFVVLGPDHEFLGAGLSLEEAVRKVADYEKSNPESFEFRKSQWLDTLYVDPAAYDYSIVEREIQ